MPDEKNQVTASEVMMEQDKQLKDQKYNDYVKQMTPKNSLPKDMLYAFLIGGIICTIGQAFNNLYKSWGADKELAASYTTLTLVFLAVLLTGLNIYQKLAKYGGAGSLVPITGFANSVASPAIEFKKEGQVFGIGCQIFTIAGPVILYGILTSWILGVIYLILKQVGVV